MNKPSFLEIESQNKKCTVDYGLFAPKNGSCAFSDHWHDNIEIIFVKSGLLSVSVGGKSFLSGPGDVCFFNTNMVHGAVSRSDETEYEMIQIKYELLIKLSHISAMTERFINHEVNIENHFSDCNFERFCRRAEDISRSGVNASLSELGFVCELFDYLFTCRQTDETAAIYSNRKFSKIIEYLDCHHTEKIAISDIAREFSFDVSYFSRKFKEITGLTPSRYINSLRIFSAEKMLSDTDGSVDFIASECGFESTQYFIRCFKAKYGISPLRYRKSILNKGHS